ncbi:hypothetical protein QOT17_25594 [Balamuthia mandrillaris]
MGTICCCCGGCWSILKGILFIILFPFALIAGLIGLVVYIICFPCYCCGKFCCKCNPACCLLVCIDKHIFGGLMKLPCKDCLFACKNCSDGSSTCAEGCEECV